MFKSDRGAAIAYCDEYAAVNPSAAFGALLRVWLPDEPARASTRLLSYLNAAYRGDDARQAGPWAAGIMREWIQRDASAAARLTTDLPIGAQPAVFAEVARQWCRQDGAKALEWASALPPGPSRDAAMLEFTYAWSQHDSTQTTAWLNKLPNDSGRWAATEGFVFSVIDTDASGALAWARTIPDEARRMDLLRRSWQRWLRQNPTSAGQWLESGTLSDAELAALKGLN
jgi:hypothetical protein